MNLASIPHERGKHCTLNDSCVTAVLSRSDALARGRRLQSGLFASRGRHREPPLATPNYSYEKRQRELAKKKKNEEKRLRKLSGKSDAPVDGSESAGEDGDTAAPEGSPDPSTPDSA